jgi:hypothetical protein
MRVISTSILVIIVAGALIGSVATMNLREAFGINSSTQNINLDSSACDPVATCNNTASTSINFVGASDNNVASEDILSTNKCKIDSTCSNDASQFLVINGDGNRATLRTTQLNICQVNFNTCSSDSDFSVGISGNNNQMDGTSNQENRCSQISTCTNKMSFISDLPPGNSGSFSTNMIQINRCVQSNCTNDANNLLGDLGQTNVCYAGATCETSGSNNLNACFNSFCTNSGDAPFGSNNLNGCYSGSVCDNSGHGTGAKSGFHNANRCLNGAVCTNSGINTNVQADGAVSCSSGTPGTTTTCLPGQPPIVRP